MLRRLLSLFLSTVLLGGIAAACSSGDGSGSPSATSTTVDFAEAQRKENLDRFASDVERREQSSIAIDADSPAGLWAAFLHVYARDQPLTVRSAGTGLRVCGVGQVEGGCAVLSDFTYNGSNQVEGFRYENRPIDDLMSGDGLRGEASTGAIASVRYQEAFLNPVNRQLYVVMNVTWSRDISPDTTGCDPTRATYSNGGPSIDGRGGGLGVDDEFLGAPMTMSFPDASLGGELQVSCYRADGSSQEFTFNVLG